MRAQMEHGYKLYRNIIQSGGEGDGFRAGGRIFAKSRG